MIQKVKRQFVRWHMAINTLVVLACFVLIYFSTLYSIQVRNGERLNLIQAEYTASGGTQSNIFERTGYAVFFSVGLDAQNQVLEARSPVTLAPGTFEHGVELLQQETRERGEVSIAGRQWAFLSISVHEPSAGGAVREVIFLDVTESYALLHTLLLVFLVAGLAIVLINYVISLLFAGHVVRPIEEAFDRQKQFVSDASHELKTPLAILTANMEALTAELDIPPENQWARNIHTQIERMDTLVKNLLYLAKFDEKGGSAELSTVNFSELADQALTELEASVYEKNLSLKSDIQPGIFIKSNAFETKQVLLILLDNAIKYTDPAGTISVRLQKTKNYAVLQIQNTCAGISEESLLHIFDRFYRANEARNHDGSFGLGLPIAKAIMDSIGGSIQVACTEHGSITFSIAFKAM